MIPYLVTYTPEICHIWKLGFLLSFSLVVNTTSLDLIGQ